MNDPRAYFPFYPADFWGADTVALMSFEAVGLYMVMLSREWEQGSISADELFWRSLYGHKCQNWDSTWAQVRPCFEEEAGRLRNKRLEAERAVADGFSSKQSAKAKAKWERWRASKSATALPRHSHGNATCMPGQDRTGPDQTGPDQTGPDRIRQDRSVPEPKKSPKPRAPRTGAQAELIRFWERRWLETRGTPYAVETKDAVAASQVLRLACGDLQEAQRRTDSLLTSPDAWMTQNASLGLLRSRWNQLAFTVVKPQNEPKGAQGIRDYLAKSHGGGA